MQNANKIQSPQPQPTQLLPTKKWYTDETLLAMVSLVVLAFLILLVYFIINQPQNLGPIVVGHKNTNNPTQNALGNLKSYANTQYGYEIQYPSNWMLEQSEGNLLTLINNSNSQTNINTVHSFSLSVSPTNVNDPMTWYTTYTDTNAGSKLTEKEDVTIGGVSGVRFCDPLSGGKIDENWIIIKSGYVYNFEATGAACDLSNKTLNDILATFKFTNNTSSSPVNFQSPNWPELQKYTIFHLCVPYYTPNGFYWSGPTNLTNGDKISDLNLSLKSDNNPSRVMVYEQSADITKAANKDLLNVTDANYTSQGFKVSHVDINGNDGLLATAYEGMATQMVHLKFLLNGTEVFLSANGGDTLSVSDITKIARSMK